MKPVVVWFTGPPAAGKTTAALAVRAYTRVLTQQPELLPAIFLLDGDDLRAGLSCDLKFSDDDRTENIRRAAHVAGLMATRSQIPTTVLASFVSPLHQQRLEARRIVESYDLAFALVHVTAPLSVRIERDPKGLYAKAKAGLLRGLTGFDGVYEEPEDADLVLDTSIHNPREITRRVSIALLKAASKDDKNPKIRAVVERVEKWQAEDDEKDRAARDNEPVLPTENN